MPLPATRAGPIGGRARVGLVLLQADEVIGQDYRRLVPSSDVAIYVTRVPSGADLTTATLVAMAVVLPRAAGCCRPRSRSTWWTMVARAGPR